MSKQVEYEVQWMYKTIGLGWDHFSTHATLAKAKKYLADDLKINPKQKGEKFRFVKVTRTETREVVK